MLLSKPTSIEEISEDILAEILHRMPFTSCLPLLFSNKRFMHLISQSEFLKSCRARLLLSPRSNFLPRSWAGDRDKVGVKASHYDLYQSQINYIGFEVGTKNKDIFHGIGNGGLKICEFSRRNSLCTIHELVNLEKSEWSRRWYSYGEFNMKNMNLLAFHLVWEYIIYFYSKKGSNFLPRSWAGDRDKVGVKASHYDLYQSQINYTGFEVGTKNKDIYHGIGNGGLKICEFSRRNSLCTIHELVNLEKSEWSRRWYSYGEFNMKNMNLPAFHLVWEYIIYFYSKKGIFLCDYLNRTPKPRVHDTNQQVDPDPIRKDDRIVRKRARKKPAWMTRLCLSSSSYDKKMFCVIDSNDKTHILKGSNFLPRSWAGDRDKVGVKASHYDLYQSQINYTVCNPFTKQHVVLPPLRKRDACEFSRVGFMYDQSRSRFWVVHVPIVCFEEVNSFQINMFSSETGKWSACIISAPANYDILMTNLCYKDILIHNEKFVWWIKEVGFLVCDPSDGRDLKWELKTRIYIMGLVMED
ncbi:unnamed protein product [Sphenostylis stenocarpa]|uniref:F-box domain-containing protein n=1 Tax=Sphenostylis stenocarpa TaxID=92480 RepID=A0AA86S0E7_9FABA|nr:unnamed protein product [Sphenostylis stenocarpa]